MASKRARTTPEIHPHSEAAQMVSGYERSREERIKENLQRMQNLGILNLTLQLKSSNSNPSLKPTKRTHFSATPLPPLAPSRRSSRLQNATPVSYCEVKVSKRDESLEFGDNLLRLEGSRPEVYTEEHEKLLGSTEKSWTFFVDGYGKDGKRIYDPVNGKTCHQCRQKTLGHRTCCSKCDLVQGQFCGDCLYMRYGEHVLEAKQNPNWICPACRGICNCSLCRQAKGWPPTGSLYRKISELGYKSVAHYLIQTRREKTDSGDKKTKVPLSAKRSLPFVETETAFIDMGTSESKYNPQELVDYNSEAAKSLENFNEDIEEKAHDSIVVRPEIALEASEDSRGSLEPEIGGPKPKVEMKKEKEVDISVEKESSNCDVMNISEDSAFPKSEIREFSCGTNSVVTPVLEQKPVASKENNVNSHEPVADGIVGRLRLSPNDNNGHEEVNDSIVDNTKPPSGLSSLEANMNLELNSFNDCPKDVTDAREDEIEKPPISKKKRARAADPVVDSIGTRLRQRRTQNKLS